MKLRYAVLGLGFTPTLLIALILIIVVMAAGAAGGDPAAMSAESVTCDTTVQQAADDDADPVTIDDEARKILNDLWPIYVEASTKHQLGPSGPSHLAAINLVETNLGRNVAESSAGAQGWMQFMPATWSQYGDDGDGDGKKDIMDREDAIFGAASYLHASGAPGDWHKAIYAYNHAEWYVQKVEKRAKLMSGQCASVTNVGYSHDAPADGVQARLRADGTVEAPKGAPPIVRKMIDAANEIANIPYGPDIGGGHPPSDKKDDAYDCSGATMWILRKAGLVDYGNMVAANFKTWGNPIDPKDPKPWVTILASDAHVFMIIAGLRYDVENPRRVGSAWHADARTFTGFEARRPPGM